MKLGREGRVVKMGDVLIGRCRTRYHFRLQLLLYCDIAYVLSFCGLKSCTEVKCVFFFIYLFLLSKMHNKCTYLPMCHKQIISYFLQNIPPHPQYGFSI